jgi:hypothetical protein
MMSFHDASRHGSSVPPTQRHHACPFNSQQFRSCHLEQRRRAMASRENNDPVLCTGKKIRGCPIQARFWLEWATCCTSIYP